MSVVSSKEQHIISVFLKEDKLQSSSALIAFQKMGMTLSLVTVKRLLSGMAARGLLAVSGTGPSTAYTISPLGRLFAEVDTEKYCAIEPDQRHGLGRYNFDLLPAIPREIFSVTEKRVLESATAAYKRRTAGISPTLREKELERLVIELSWKSSKIEGNTYTLLDTEKLIREDREAPGHPLSEARMILNHKDAFMYIYRHRRKFTVLTRVNLENIHELLTKGLGVRTGLRRQPIGVVGSKYRPLDNMHQIRDAIAALTSAVSRSKTPYDKALIALLGISYIQPFEDGNKRTSRLMANALLLAHGCAPLSYRSIKEEEYRAAILVFYEVNSLVPIKNIFISQYEFAAKNYLVPS